MSMTTRSRSRSGVAMETVVHKPPDDDPKPIKRPSDSSAKKSDSGARKRHSASSTSHRTKRDIPEVYNENRLYDFAVTDVNSIEENLKNIKLDLGGTVVYTFGRFQPPTKGHELLIDIISRVATELHANYHIFVSQKVNDLTKIKDITETKFYSDKSKDTLKNPLYIDNKLKYMRIMFANHEQHIMSSITHFTILNYLRLYKNLILVLGSDRTSIDDISMFNSLHHSAKEKGMNLIIVSAGKTRDDMSDELEGMSGTKVRTFAVQLRFGEFFDCINIGNMTPRIAFEMMNDIRAGLGFPIIRLNELDKLVNTSEEMKAELQNMAKGGMKKVGSKLPKLPMAIMQKLSRTELKKLQKLETSDLILGKKMLKAQAEYTIYTRKNDATSMKARKMADKGFKYMGKAFQARSNLVKYHKLLRNKYS